MIRAPIDFNDHSLILGSSLRCCYFEFEVDIRGGLRIDIRQAGWGLMEAVVSGFL